MPQMDKIRVFIADDHPIARRGIAMLIDGQQDMEVVGEAANGDDAIDGIKQLRPDVALIDMDMPRASGLEVTEEVSGMFQMYPCLS